MDLDLSLVVASNLGVLIEVIRNAPAVIDDKITYQHLKFMKTVQLLRFEILGDIGSFLSVVVEPLKRG